MRDLQEYQIMETDKQDMEATGEVVALGYEKKDCDRLSSGASDYGLGIWPSYYEYGQGDNDGESCNCRNSI